MNEVQMAEGVAQHMGEGTFVLCQQSDEGSQSVVVTEDDLRRLLAQVA